MTEEDPGYIDTADRLLNAGTRGGFLVIGIRCARCGQVLTAPDSMRAGVGPVCARRPA